MHDSSIPLSHLGVMYAATITLPADDQRPPGHHGDESPVFRSRVVVRAIETGKQWEAWFSIHALAAHEIYLARHLRSDVVRVFYERHLYPELDRILASRADEPYEKVFDEHAGIANVFRAIAARPQPSQA